MISYGIALHKDVLDALERTGLKNYTCLSNVTGVGSISEPHLGTEVWPNENAALYTVVADSDATKLMDAIRELRKTLGKEGIKAFMLPVEDET